MKLFEDEIKFIPVDDMEVNKINPNSMPAPTFEKLKLSLEKFGLMNPIIVAKIEGKYIIIDGEHRWKASKEIGLREIQAKIIEAKEEDIAGLIFASTIKGKHDVYAATDLISNLAKTKDTATLKAMNLDKLKIERKIKYHGKDKLKPVDKKGRNMKSEVDSYNVKPMKDYKRLIVLVDAPKYCKIEDGKVVLK